MSRELTAAENQTLAKLQGEIDQIVARAGLAELTSTTVLAGADPAPDYTLFQDRFRRLGLRLAELVQTGLVKVEEGLDPAMEANTSISRGARPELIELQLRPSLLAEPNEKSLTARALVLVHELSHALREHPVFPVKDYSYRKGWSWGHLPAAFAADNADTFAEAAALLAERNQQRWGRYQELGRVPAQRFALAKAMEVTHLGAALALADLHLNRAWLRAHDTRVMARAEIGKAIWADTLARWQAEPDYIELMQIETDLRNFGLIGARETGDVKVALSTADKTTVTRIYQHFAALKRALGQVTPVPVATGTKVVYHATTGQLEIPHAVAGLGAAVLADRIIDALITGKPAADPMPPVYTAQCRTIVDLMVHNDRPAEKAAIALLRTHFTSRPTIVPPTQAQWAELAVDLLLAEFADISGRWTVRAAQAEDLVTGPAAERVSLETVADSLKPDLDRAIVLGGLLPGTEQEFRKMAVALVEIRKAAVTCYPKERAALDAVVARLNPFVPCTIDWKL